MEDDAAASKLSDQIVSYLHKFKWSHRNKVHFRLNEFEDVSAPNIKLGSHIFKTIRLENITKSVQEINPQDFEDYKNGKVVGFKIGNLRIIVGSEELDELKSYLTDEKDGSETFTNSILIQGKTWALKDIELEVAAIINSLSNRGLLTQLNEKQNLIPYIPIIMWKIGWTHSAYLMLNWIKGSGNSVQLPHDWVNNYARSKQGFIEAVSLLSSVKTGSDLFNQKIGMSRNSMQSLITTTRRKRIGEEYVYGNFNLSTGLNEANPTNFIGSISIGSDLGDLDDLGGALGRFRLSMYVKGKMKKVTDEEAEMNNIEIGLRFSDVFSFEDNDDLATFIQGGSQILGNWIDDVYDPRVPSTSYFEGSRIQLTNEIFRQYAVIGQLQQNRFFTYTEPRFLKSIVKEPIKFELGK
jgi:hypothetical protein